MEFLGNVFQVLVSPVNCVANYGADILGATAKLVTCVASNITSIGA